MPLSLTDLTTPLTPADVQRVIYSVLSATGVTTTTWKPGGVVRTLITGVSYIASAFSELLADLASSAFLSTSSGDWLALIAQNVYSVTPIPATAATTTVNLTNLGGGVYVLDVGDLTVTNPTTQQSYFNTEAVTIGALATDVPCIVTAFVAGAVGTSLPGEITSIQSPPLAQVTVTNPFAAVGTDAETDPSIRQRCLDKLGSLSPNGPSDAYAFVARTAVDQFGQPMGITRVKVTNDAFGHVDVYLATASGNVAGTVGDLNSPLGIVDDLMQRMAAPLAVTLRTHSANQLAVDVTYQIWLYNTSGLTVAQIQTTIQANLTQFLVNQPIGGNVIGTDPGKIFVSALEAVIGGSVTPQGVKLSPIKVVVSVPTGDKVLSADDAPVVGSVIPLGIVQLKGSAL